MDSPTGRIRVLIADDHPAIRDGLSAIIQGRTDMQLCGACSSAAEAYHLVEKEKPDVVLIDISLGDDYGLDVMHNLKVQFPSLKGVMYSMFDELDYAAHAIRAGASGYVMKQEPVQNVIEAIRCASRGEIYVSRKIASVLLSRFEERRKRVVHPPLRELTEREAAVFNMLAHGRTPVQIGRKLHMTRKTVEGYRRRIREKLSIATNDELLLFAHQWYFMQGS